MNSQLPQRDVPNSTRFPVLYDVSKEERNKNVVPVVTTAVRTSSLIAMSNCKEHVVRLGNLTRLNTVFVTRDRFSSVIRTDSTGEKNLLEAIRN